MEKKKKSFWSRLKDKLSKKKDQTIEDETEEEFEGDGRLGIKFGEINRKVVVKSIDPGTVADESYDLKTQMVVTRTIFWLWSRTTKRRGGGGGGGGADACAR